VKPLLTHLEFEARIQQLREAHPWVGQSIIRIAPGHLAAVEALLVDIEEIASKTSLKKHVNFLRIELDSDRALQFFFDLFLSSNARSTAVQAAILRAKSASGRVCLGCGEKINYGRILCESHITVFADDIPPAPPEELLSEVAESPEIVEPEPEPEPESAEPEKLTVSVFDPAAIEILDKSRAGKDGESKERIASLVKRLKTTSGRKSLATIPARWAELVHEIASDFPNFAEFAEFLRHQFALTALADGRLKLPPVLFSGPPGIGKTEIAMSLAELLSTGSLVVDMASAQCGADLSGSDAYFSNSREGRLFEILAFGETANPVIVLEELDKVNQNNSYRADGGLYGLLEPKTAKHFRDLSVRDLSLDASHIVWFATANDLNAIPAPILSRFVIFEIPAPTREQAEAIAKTMYCDIRNAYAWGGVFAEELSTDVATRLAEGAPREIRTMLQRGFGKAALEGRTELVPDDIPAPTTRKQQLIGFVDAR